MARGSLNGKSYAMYFNSKNGEMWTTLPLMSVGGNLTKDISFEDKVTLRKFESNVKELTSRLARVFIQVIDLLQDDYTFEDFAAVQKEAISILQSSVTYYQAAETYSRKFASLKIQWSILELEWMADEARYLKQVASICKSMERLSSPLARPRQEQFRLWFNTQISRLGRPEDSTRKDVHIEIERLLTENCLRLESDESVIGRGMLKAKNALDMLRELKSVQADESLLKRIQGLRKIKKNRQTLGKYISQFEFEKSKPDDFPLLLKLVEELQERIKEVPNLLYEALKMARRKLAEEVEQHLSLSSIRKKQTPALDEFTELLKLTQHLSTQKSTFDVWVVHENVAQDLLASAEQYKSAHLKSKRRLLKLVTEPLHIYDSSNQLKVLLTQYQLTSDALQLVNRLLHQERRWQTFQVQEKALSRLIELADEQRTLLKKKEILCFEESLKSSTNPRHNKEVSMRQYFFTIQYDLERAFNIKKEIEEIWGKLGGVLFFAYRSFFVQNIKEVRDLLLKYVWVPRRSFQSEKLVCLVEELSQDRRGVGIEHEWINLYWNIASLLSEAIHFVSLPNNLINLTELEYKRWCDALGPNTELHIQVKNAVKRISVIDSKISAKLLSRLEEMVLPFDHMSRAHQTLQQIEEIRNSLTTSQFMERLRPELDGLFQKLFMRMGYKEINTVKERIVGIYASVRGKVANVCGSGNANCALIKEMQGRLVKELASTIRRLSNVTFGHNDSYDKLYEQYESLVSYLASCSGEFEALTFESSKILFGYIQARVDTCCGSFNIPKDYKGSSSALGTQMLASKLQTVKILQSVQEAVSAARRVNIGVVEDLALEISSSLFGLRSLEEAKLIMFSELIKEAAEKVDRLSQLLASYKQHLDGLSKVLRNLLTLVQQLFQGGLTNEQQYGVLGKMMQLLNPPESGWWIIRTRDLSLVLFYGFCQTALLNFLTTLIQQTVPQLKEKEIAISLQRLVVVTGQVYEINSVDQFNCTANRLLQKRMLQNSQVERQLQQVYEELWEGVILGEVSVMERSLGDKMKASKEILKKGCTIGLKSPIKLLLEQTSKDISILHDFFNSIKSQDIGVKDIHRFSATIKRLSCLNLSQYKEFRDHGSGMVYFLYRTPSSLEQMINKGLRKLLQLSTSTEWEDNESLVKWWRDKVLALSQTRSEIVLDQLLNSYSFAQLFSPKKNIKIPETIKNLLSRVNKLSSQASDNLPAKESKKEIATIKEPLQFHVKSISQKAINRHPWLRQLRDCIQETVKEIDKLTKWLEEAKRISEVERPLLEDIKKLAKQFKELRPLLSLNKEIGLLLSHQKQELGAFVVSEESSLVSTRTLFTKFYAEDLEFSEELWNKGTNRLGDEDVLIVSCLLEVNFLLKGELDEDMLDGYTVRLYIHERQIASSEALQPVAIELPIDQINQLQAKLLWEGEQMGSSTEKILLGNSIRFTSLAGQISIDIEKKLSKLTGTFLTNDTSTNTRVAELPKQMPSESVIQI